MEPEKELTQPSQPTSDLANDEDKWLRDLFEASGHDPAEFDALTREEETESEQSQAEPAEPEPVQATQPAAPSVQPQPAEPVDPFEQLLGALRDPNQRAGALRQLVELADRAGVSWESAEPVQVANIFDPTVEVQQRLNEILRKQQQIELMLMQQQARQAEEYAKQMLRTWAKSERIELTQKEEGEIIDAAARMMPAGTDYQTAVTVLRTMYDAKTKTMLLARNKTAQSSAEVTQEDISGDDLASRMLRDLEEYGKMNP